MDEPVKLNTVRHKWLDLTDVTGADAAPDAPPTLIIKKNGVTQSPGAGVATVSLQDDDLNSMLLTVTMPATGYDDDDELAVRCHGTVGGIVFITTLFQSKVVSADESDLAASIASNTSSLSTLTTNLATLTAFVDTEIQSIITAVNDILTKVDTEIATLQTTVNNILNAVDTEIANMAASVLTAIKADPEWKSILSSAEGQFTADIPEEFPGTGTVVQKNRDGSEDIVEFELTFNADGVVTQRTVVE